VHITVGKRRAIMQNKQLPAFSRSLNLLVKLRFFPSLEHVWFASRKIRLHRKFRARQIQRVFVVLTHTRLAVLRNIRVFTNQRATILQSAKHGDCRDQTS
jgi:hypothetical protein